MSYNIVDIQNSLFDLVSFRNTMDTDEYTLDSNIFGTPESGQYYNDSFALLELDNLKYLSPFQEGWNYEVYSSSTVYNENDIVKSTSDNSVYYISLVDSNQGNSLTDTNYWARKYPFSEWLEKKIKNNVINPLFNEVFLKKKLNQVSKSLLTNLNLFKGVSNINKTVVKAGRFVNMKFQLASYKNVKLIIDKIGLQFTEAESFNLYVYHSSQYEPIRTIPVTYSKANRSSEWFTLDQEIELEFDSNDYDSGGYFYIGYYENDINGSAIRFDYNYGGACTSCGSNASIWREHYDQYSKFMIVEPSMVLNGNLNGTNLWDIDHDNAVSNQNWGLNFSFRIVCDVTNFIITNRSLFTNALIQKAKNWVCEEIVNSDRDSNFVSKMKSQALYNMSADGLNFPKMLQNEINAIDFDLSDLGTPCCPKKPTNTVRTRTA